jgi:hypothetical protein
MNAPEKSNTFTMFYVLSKDWVDDSWKESAVNYANSELKIDYITIDNIEFSLMEHDDNIFNDKSLNYYRMKITLDKEIPVDEEMKKSWLETHKVN